MKIRNATIIGVLVALCALGLFSYLYRTTSSTYEQGTFGGVSLNIQFATTTAELDLGLGNRVSLPSDYGMLFVFPDDERWGFWMKDTLIPLDMFWLDDQGHVIWMEQEVATTTYPNVFYPPTVARYVLETAAGFASAHSIATGTALSLPTWPNTAL